MADVDAAVRKVESDTLSNSEYIAMQSRLELIAGLAVSTDPHTLDLFIQQAERATSLGPLLDPSLYMLGGEKLRGVITHARALARFAAAIRETL